MIPTIKSTVYTGVWFIICMICFSTYIMWFHVDSERDLRARVDELATRMECKKKSCDRFKRQDAQELEKRLMDEIKKECTKK